MGWSRKGGGKGTKEGSGRGSKGAREGESGDRCNQAEGSCKGLTRAPSGQRRAEDREGGSLGQWDAV